jgi:plasmid stabilization system protein ParE
MSFEVRFQSKAEEEYLHAVIWYENKQKGLGGRFVTSVEIQIKRIIENPEHYPLKKSQYRQSKAEHFPYVVVFKLYPIKKLILIISIFHTSRRPSKKFRG